MADVNVNAPTITPPTRTDDQILSHSRWVPIRKRNYYLDVEKSQSNLIYKIDVDILKHTNYFRAFTASLTILSIYIQQFWDTIQYDIDTVRYICQLDKQWFDLTKETLRDALQITPVNNNYLFSSPLKPDTLINFVNNLGYPKVVRTLSAVVTNDIEDVGRIHPIHPFLCRRQKESGTAYSGKEESQSYCNPKYSIHQADHSSLQSMHKFHPKPDSPLNLPYEEYILGYLKFSAKGTKREVFGMPIPNELITTDIQGSDLDSPAPKPAKATKKSKPSARKAYLRPPIIKPSSSQQPKPKLAPAKSQEKKRKLVTETSDKPSPAKRSKPGLVTKRRKPTSSLRSVDEFVDEGIPAKEPRFDDEENDIQMAVEESLKSEVPPMVEVGGQDEGQAGPNPGVLIEGQAGSNLGDDVEPQPQSSPVVHAGLNLKHMDLEATDKTKAESMVSVTIQQDTSVIPPMTTPITDLTSRPDSPNVHRPLQAMTTKTTTTITKTTHPPPPQPQQSTIDSMLIKRIGELEQIMANLIQDNKHLEERLDSHGARLYTLENLDIPQQVSKAVDEIVTDVVDWAIQALLWNRFRDLPEADIKEILHQRTWETNSYKAHEDHMMLYEALEKYMNRDHTDELLINSAEARKKKKKRHDSLKTPPMSPPHQLPPPPSPAGPSRISRSPRDFGSSQVQTLPPPPPSTNQEAWTTTDTRLRPSVSLIPKDLHIDDDMAPDEHVYSSDDEDIRNAYIPKVNLQHD
nr:hypothetical protein [Tanacetum cinerariifolium]